MDRAGQFFGEGGVDLALALHSAQALEGGGGNLDGEMAFAPGPRAGVAGVLGAIVGNFQRLRLEDGLQFCVHPIGHSGHIRLVNP